MTICRLMDLFELCVDYLVQIIIEIVLLYLMIIG